MNKHFIMPLQGLLVPRLRLNICTRPLRVFAWSLSSTDCYLATKWVNVLIQGKLPSVDVVLITSCNLVKIWIHVWIPFG